MERSIRIYLDHAATTPMTAAACTAVAEGMADWANPSSPHAEGRAARARVETARRAVADAYGWRHETLFTSGASESLAIVLNRAIVDRVLVSAVEHDAVLRAAGRAATLPVGTDGRVDPNVLEAALNTPPPFVSSEVEKLAPGTRQGVSTSLDTNGRGRARMGELDTNGGVGARMRGRPLVAIQWANSETGVRQSIADLAAVVHAAGALLLVDAAQMPTDADPEVAAHADFVVLSAHKRGGPPGVGALLVRDLATLSPTGGQERGYRPGTENLPGLLGYAAALAEPEPDHAALRATLDDAIRRSGGEIVGEASPRHPAIGSYRLPGVASATQLIRLDMAGFAVSAGSACASGSLKPSHVLAAMGWSETAGREVVRVSFGRTTTEADVTAFVQAWRGIARETRRFVA